MLTTLLATSLLSLLATATVTPPAPKTYPITIYDYPGFGGNPLNKDYSQTVNVKLDECQDVVKHNGGSIGWNTGLKCSFFVSGDCTGAAVGPPVNAPGFADLPVGDYLTQLVGSFRCGATGIVS